VLTAAAAGVQLAYLLTEVVGSTSMLRGACLLCLVCPPMLVCRNPYDKSYIRVKEDTRPRADERGGGGGGGGGRSDRCAALGRRNLKQPFHVCAYVWRVALTCIVHRMVTDMRRSWMVPCTFCDADVTQRIRQAVPLCTHPVLFLQV
jgi:hypothetical protein